MKRLVSALGVIIVINEFAMNSHALSCATYNFLYSDVKFESKHLYCDDDVTEKNNWKVLGNFVDELTAESQVRELAENLESQLKLNSFLKDFENSNHKYFTLELLLALRRMITNICYIVPSKAKKQNGFSSWLLVKKKCYQVFENEKNIASVKKYMPNFLKGLSMYLKINKSSIYVNGNSQAAMNLIKKSLNNLPSRISAVLRHMLENYDINLNKR